MENKKKVLVVTNGDDPHSDLIIPALVKEGIEIFRFNMEDFLSNVSITSHFDGGGVSNSIDFGDCVLDCAEVGCVIWRKPMGVRVQTFGIERLMQNFFSRFGFTLTSGVTEFAKNEAERAVVGLWHNMPKAFWINHPHQSDRARNKLFQLRIALEVGGRYEVRVADTVVTSDPKTAENFCREGTAVYKTLTMPAIFEGDDVLTLYATAIEHPELFDFGAVAVTPCQFQKEISRQRDIKVVVFGDKIFAFGITGATETDLKSNPEALTYELLELPQAVLGFCQVMMAELGIVFATIDFIQDVNGIYWFLEVNPRGQWYFLEEITGVPLLDAFVELVKEHLSFYRTPLN